MEHILIGKDLLLKIDQITSANLCAIDKEGKPCIKVKLIDGNEWTIWANLENSRQILRSIPKINDQFDLIENIKSSVFQSRAGRESNISKEIKELINSNKQ